MDGMESAILIAGVCVARHGEVLNPCGGRWIESPESRVGLNSSSNRIMATATHAGVEHIQRHKDGSLWAKGRLVDGAPSGYWEWFRKDGTRLRSGHFENGEQVGEWITFDKQGQKYKVTQIRPKSA